jgi:hypothetical protein
MARGVAWGRSSSGRTNRHRSELLIQQFEVFKYGARQLVGVVDAFVREVRYLGGDDFGGEVIWRPKAERDLHTLSNAAFIVSATSGAKSRVSIGDSGLKRPGRGMEGGLPLAAWAPRASNRLTDGLAFKFQ